MSPCPCSHRPCRSAALVLAACLGFCGPALADAAGGNPADAAFAKAMDGMMAAMHRAKPTGDTDLDFVDGMMPHHQAAVDMAEAELRYGSDPELKQLAADIVAAQKKEIAQMQAWRARHLK